MATIVRAMTTERGDRLYVIVRAIARFWVWFFFKSVHVGHPERVPGHGPVLLCVNHPNNLIDSVLLATAVRRKVHYLATSALFRNPLLARFLRACGAIPVYRRQDDPDRMDRNTEAFAACFEAFRRGELIAIYPEGTTHAETRVQRIRTGAARIALGWDAEEPGRLAVVPVGLNFESRKSFRGRVLVSFGHAVPVAPYQAAFRADPVKAVEALTQAIQWAMEAEIVHADRIDTADLVRAIEELYRGDLIHAVADDRGLDPSRVDPFRLSRSIVDAVNHFKARDPQRVEVLWQRIQAYRVELAAWRVSDQALAALMQPSGLRARLRRSSEAVVGFPFFLYGAIVNALPYYVPRWLAHQMSTRETDYATVRLLASVVAVPLFWGLEVWIVWRLSSALWAGAFALSLPVSGLLAYRYRVGTGRLRNRLKAELLAVTRGAAFGRLVAERRDIVAELDRAKSDYLIATKGSAF